MPVAYCRMQMMWVRGLRGAVRCGWLDGGRIGKGEG